jgi:hypothetical protein
MWRAVGAISCAAAMLACPGSSGSARNSLAVSTRQVIGTSADAGRSTAADCDTLLGAPPPAHGREPISGPRTAVPGDVVRVAAVGDVGSSSGLDRPVPDLVAGLDPDGLLLIGDNVHGTGGTTEFGEHFDPTWSRFGDIWMPVVGNHEYRVDRAAAYRAYFGRPEGPLHSCWRIGARIIIALDSKRPGDAEQQSWLRSILASTTGVPKVVTWHRPRYSSGARGDRKGTGRLWREIRGDPDVHLVLWAHDHDYERMAVPVEGRAPLDAMVVGTGGGTPQPTPPMVDRPWRAFFVDHTTGVLDLSLAPTWFAWSFVAVPGLILDSGAREL